MIKYLLLLIIAVLSGLTVPQNILGAACSSGGLTTSTNKVFQMTYPNETFLQLTNVDLLKDVSQLKDLTCLQYLDATDRTIKGDLANLTDLTNLEVLSLYSNPEVSGDICSLAGATKLRSLKLAFNPKITGDVSCLKNLTKLETFAMTDTQISGDLSVFANMPNLKALYINGTDVKGDICSLRKLTSMEELGIADEVGNPDITGDLACLDGLQKLKRVSLYNTKTTNCGQFTRSHQNLANTTTESGKQGGGGCSKESRQTLKNQNQKYERKIGKEQTQTQKQSNYQKDTFSNFVGGEDVQEIRRNEESENRNFITKFMDIVSSLLSRVPILGNIIGGKQTKQGDRPDFNKGGSGGCKSEEECKAFCSNAENREACSKFAPPDEER